VNARHQRLPQTLDGLLSESAAQEGRDRFVAGLASARDHEVEAHPDLPRPGEQAAAQEGQHARGDREHHAFGQRMEPSAAQDEDLPALGVGGDQPIAQAQLANESQSFRLLGQDRVGPAFDEEAVDRLRPDDAAPARGGLAEDERDLPLRQRAGGGEAGDAAADHRHFRPDLRHRGRGPGRPGRQ
jgi:hypothetical protein